MLPDVGKRCTLDSLHASTTSSISEVGKSSEGISSQVDDTGDFRQEGRLTWTSFRCLAVFMFLVLPAVRFNLTIFLMQGRMFPFR